MLLIAQFSQVNRGIRGLQHAIAGSADIAMLPVRLTRDERLVVSNSPHLSNNPKEPRIRQATLKQLRRHTAGSEQPIVALSTTLRSIFGQIMLAIEVNERSAVIPLLEHLKPFIKRQSDWSNLVIASSNPLILRKLRSLAPHAQLALVTSRHTPLAFAAWQPILQLSAVMIHRLSANILVVEAAHRLDLLVCAYTVDRKQAVKHLSELGVDAFVTNHPEKFL